MLRHVIRLTSVHEGADDTAIVTANLNLWLEAFFTASVFTHLAKDWGIVSISRQEVAGPLEPESDLPPTPISYYPNRISPIQPWTPTA